MERLLGRCKGPRWLRTQRLAWEELGQECRDTDLSATDLGSRVPDFVSVPGRIGWEQEDQQGGRVLHEPKQEVCSPLK